MGEFYFFKFKGTAWRSKAPRVASCCCLFRESLKVFDHDLRVERVERVERVVA